MTNAPAPDLYTLAELSNVPPHPGLYAWYARIQIGKFDISTDAGLRDILDQQQGTRINNGLNLTASLGFSWRWHGIVAPRAPKKSMPKLQNGLSDSARSEIARILNAAHPHFLRPLYIGQASISLRKRLREHADEYFRLRDLRDRGELQQQSDDNFAKRATSFDIPPDNLVCYVATVDVNNLSDKREAAAVLDVTESYLNDWATPPLGRR